MLSNGVKLFSNQGSETDNLFTDSCNVNEGA